MNPKQQIVIVKRKSKYRGVSYDKNNIRAIVCVNKKLHHIGYYKTEVEAALAYNKKAQ